MDNLLRVLQVVMPIFFTFFLGVLARKRSVLSVGEIDGMQRFVVKFCIPCLLFRSCLTAELTAQVLSSMVILPLLLISTLWAFSARKKQFPYTNFPFLFCCKETGMMGIPLFMILFGVEQAYRVGILDLTQALIGYPMLAILSTDVGENASVRTVLRQMATSPMIVLSVLGVVLNVSGVWALAEASGVGAVLLETLSFMSQPVSTVMLFCVGYNFILSGESRAVVLRITAIHVAIFALMGVIVQGALYLIPGVDALTRWAALMYCILPTSYLAPGLGKKQEESVMASGVCSITTLLCLAVFCIMAAVTA